MGASVTGELVAGDLRSTQELVLADATACCYLDSGSHVWRQRQAIATGGEGCRAVPRMDKDIADITRTYEGRAGWVKWIRWPKKEN
ncbi:hypothetical protein ACLOJK_000305 [Asimina triloba]